MKIEAENRTVSIEMKNVTEKYTPDAARKIHSDLIAAIRKAESYPKNFEGQVDNIRVSVGTGDRMFPIRISILHGAKRGEPTGGFGIVGSCPGDKLDTSGAKNLIVALQEAVRFAESNCEV